MKKWTMIRATSSGGGNWQRESLTFSRQASRVALLCLIWLRVASPAFAQSEAGKQTDLPTVGQSRMIEQLFLPGSRLQARPVTDDKQPIILRFVNAFPQGTLGYRYDLLYVGYEPGSFDLRDYLMREDGSSTDDLPPIPVQIGSLLPPGQIEPNALPGFAVPRLGGYQLWLVIGIIFWCWVLAALLLVGRPRKSRQADPDASVTLADLLRPRIQAAMENRLDARQYAELERMLIALWQRRLQLNDLDPSEVIRKVRQHPESGPLMQALERWMHDPAADRSVDLTKLLQPLSRLSASDVDWNASQSRAAAGLPGNEGATP